jgi:nucleoid-associated protein YgaU
MDPLITQSEDPFFKKEYITWACLILSKMWGADLLGKGDNDAKEVETLLKNSLGNSLTEIRVSVDNDTVILEGKADSQESREKAILLAGNVKGIEKVIADALEAPVAHQKVEFYTIKSGDTLSKIAKQYYGDAMKYPIIFKANRQVIRDADLIYPGQKIRIPAID